MAVSAGYLTKVKAAAHITAALYDTEVTDAIEAARLELARNGIDSSVAASESDKAVQRAIVTLVKSDFAESDAEAIRLMESFEKQCARLSLSDGYREVVEE